jgi:hypothetical protein
VVARSRGITCTGALEQAGDALGLRHSPLGTDDGILVVERRGVAGDLVL